MPRPSELTLTLTRIAYLGNITVGVIQINARSIYTLEPRWLGVGHEDGCLSCGLYSLRSDSLPEWGRTYRITGIPGQRTRVFVPWAGNTDLAPCIAVTMARPALWSAALAQSGEEAHARIAEHSDRQRAQYLHILNTHAGE